MDKYSRRVRSQLDQCLVLIEAIADRSADQADLAEMLRGFGLASAVDVVHLLREALGKQSTPKSDLSVPLPLAEPYRKPDPQTVARSVHRQPYLPFLLNGVRYDPQDINRFDGKELHLIQSRDPKLIIAIDDGEFVHRWLQFLRLFSMTGASVGLFGNGKGADFSQYQYGGYHWTTGPRNSPSGSVHSRGDIGIRGFGGDQGGFPDPVPGQIPGQGGGDNMSTAGAGLDGAATMFCEDDNLKGINISLAKNRGYYDLTEVKSGLLNTNDWNDEISSLLMDGTSFTRLWEHIHWQGNSLTLFQTEFSLRSFGWNDVASSVETW